jgi:hypothetical protein
LTLLVETLNCPSSVRWSPRNQKCTSTAMECITHTATFLPGSVNSRLTAGVNRSDAGRPTFKARS